MILKDKIVLVTGGAVRVGNAITVLLAESGATVYCHYNSSADAAHTLAAEQRKKGRKIELIQANLENLEAIQKMYERIIDKSGQIDVLVNNAAVFFPTRLGSVSEEQWDSLFTINLKAPFFLSQTVGMHMKKRGQGKIISIGDPSGNNPWPGFIPYGLTKGGIISMTKGLARALAPQVQVNCINPGPVLIPADYTQEEREQAISRTLLKKEGSAADIASAVKFLVEGSDYITGTILNVDGGRSIN